MHLTDAITITQRLAPKLRRKLARKLLKPLQLLPQRHALPRRRGGIHVQQHRQQRLGTARILDSLFGEEKRFRGGREGRAGGGRGERGGGVFEEEDDAVDGGEGGEGGGVEGDELFELDAGYAEVVEEEGEDSGVGFD